ncbi:MAG TPA: tetratricopeptide repeat protein [Gammaproteobacteria bacterium]|nr:tetratricopeptide repeat protein [Gammaproteobacteria bacterium]
MKRLPEISISSLPMVIALLGAAALAGCAAGPEPRRPPASSAPAPQEPVAVKPAIRPVVKPTPLPAPQVQPPAAPSSTVLALLERADTRMEQGDLAAAAASLERALRIEPRNPRLWNRLARIRLRQGNYSQAASLAAKSSSLAAGDAELLADNRAIIEQARRH